MPSFWSSNAAGGRRRSPVCPTALTKDPSRAIIRNTNMHSTGFMQHLSHDCLACLIVFTPRAPFLAISLKRECGTHQMLSFSHRGKTAPCLSQRPSTLLRKNHKRQLTPNRRLRLRDFVFQALIYPTLDMNVRTLCSHLFFRPPSSKK